MKRSAELIGLPVISISEGCQFGKVKELLVNASAGIISALVLEADEKKWYYGAELIPFESVIGIGDSALIIENSKDILPFAAREEFEKFFESGVKIINTKVLTRNGKFQGKVNEFFVDATGKIDTCEMEQVDGAIVNIPAKSIVTFGREILIIQDEGEESLITVQSKSAPPQEKKPAPPAPEEKTPAPQPAVSEPPAPAAPPKPPAPAPAPAPQPTAPAAPAAPAASPPPNNVPPTAPVTPIVPPAAPKPELPPADAAMKKTEGKPRDFLIGKKATRRIESEKGALIIEENGIVTEEVLQKATLANKLIDLSMSVV